MLTLEAMINSLKKCGIEFKQRHFLETLEFSTKSGKNVCLTFNGPEPKSKIFKAEISDSVKNTKVDKYFSQYMGGWALDIKKAFRGSEAIIDTETIIAHGREGSPKPAFIIRNETIYPNSPTPHKITKSTTYPSSYGTKI